MMVAWIALGLTVPFYIVIVIVIVKAWPMIRQQREARRLLRDLNQG